METLQDIERCPETAGSRHFISAQRAPMAGVGASPWSPPCEPLLVVAFGFLLFALAAWLFALSMAQG